MKWIDVLHDLPEMGMICWAYSGNRSILCVWIGVFVDLYDRNLVTDVNFWMEAEIICPHLPPVVKQKKAEQFDWLLPQLGEPARAVAFAGVE